VRRDLDRGWNWLRGLAACVAVAGGLAWPGRSPGDEPPAAAAPTASPAAQPAYWQVPPLPQAVVQGGVIPPGWQPQAVPYQGVGPDGQPMTMYFAPTYVFTYQAGPPMPAAPQVNRRGWWSGQPAPTMAAPMASGWNYSTSGAPPVTTALPPGGVTPYRSAYRFPADARALQGTDLTPPGPLPAASPPTDAWSGVTAMSPPPPSQQPSPPPQPPAPPPPPMAPPPIAPPPTQWVPSQPASVAAPPAAVGMAAAPAAMAVSPPPAAPPPTVPIAAAPPPQPVPIQPLAPPPAPPASRRLWRVVGVYDGDTVACLDESGQQQKVKLAGIMAPDTSQPHGRESREALAALVFGRVVEVVDGSPDAAGTWNGRLFVDGSDVNRQLVATGNAWCDSAANDPALTAAQGQAQAQRLGLWAQASGDSR